MVRGGSDERNQQQQPNKIAHFFSVMLTLALYVCIEMAFHVQHLQVVQQQSRLQAIIISLRHHHKCEKEARKVLTCDYERKLIG